jgi:DNA-binding NarL/FixJ family response regulator
VSGFAALIDIQERLPDVPVITMSGLDDAVLVREALDRGARGFIPKTSSSSVILNAIRLVLSGGTYVPREIMAAPDAARNASRIPLPDPPAVSPAELGLTPRQTDVLGEILVGKSNKMICRDLGLSEGTVKNHVAAILKALRVTTRVQAVVAAARIGLKIGDGGSRR